MRALFLEADRHTDCCQTVIDRYQPWYHTVYSDRYLEEVRALLLEAELAQPRPREQRGRAVLDLVVDHGIYPLVLRETILM